MNSQKKRNEIYVASMEGKVEVVRAFLRAGGDPHVRRSGGDTALGAAAVGGQLRVLELFLDEGADVNLKDPKGGTALHYAAYYGELAVVRALLRRGADAAARDKEGKTALDWAEESGRAAVAQALATAGELELIIFQGDRERYDTTMMDIAVKQVVGLVSTGQDFRQLLTKEHIEQQLDELLRKGVSGLQAGPERTGSDNRGIRFWNLTDLPLRCESVDDDGQSIKDEHGRVICLKAAPFDHSGGFQGAGHSRWCVGQMSTPMTAYRVSVDGLLGDEKYFVSLGSSQSIMVRVKETPTQTLAGGAAGVAAEEGAPPQAGACKKCAAGERCEIYQAFVRYEFTEIGYQHLTSVEHPMIPCRYGPDCRAHARLRAGGREFKDVCHCCIYAHGRAERAVWPEGVVPLAKPGKLHESEVTAGDTVLYKDIGDPTILKQLRENGETLIRSELRAHGLEHEMRLLREVVPSLRRHPRLAEAQAADTPCKERMFGPDIDHKSFAERGVTILVDSPVKFESEVLDIELLSLLLYTGTEAQGLIRKALRAPQGDKVIDGWQWTLHAIKHAVIKLSECPPRWLYHGLNGVGLREEDYRMECDTFGTVYKFGYSNLISTSMSVDMATTFAIGAGGTVAQADVKTVGAVLCFDTARGDQFGFPHERAYADLRWISKFPDEQEWLMIPLSDFSVPTVETESASGRDRHGFLNRTATLEGPRGVQVKVDYFSCAWKSQDD